MAHLRVSKISLPDYTQRAFVFIIKTHEQHRIQRVKGGNTPTIEASTGVVRKIITIRSGLGCTCLLPMLTLEAVRRMKRRTSRSHDMRAEMHL